MAVALPATAMPRPYLRLLQAGSLTSTVDRFVVAPVLVSVAAGFGTSIAHAAPVAGLYFLLYGVTQPLWGIASERLGRVPTMRVSLLLAGVTGLASAAAPHLGALVVLRALTGACMSAVVPGGLVYVGDAVPFAERQRTLTDLNAATGAGITAATGLGGLLAAAVSWRLAFALPAAGALALSLALRSLPEPDRAQVTGRLPWSRLLGAWPLCVLGLALLEGAALLGLLTYVAPVLHADGLGTGTAGLLAASYGLGMIAASRLVKRLSGRRTPAWFVAVGGVLLAAALTGDAASPSPAVVTAGALTIGAGWACMHSTMQAWSTEVLPEARALMVAMFAGALFVGSGVTTSLLAPLAGSSRWHALFAVGAALAVTFTVLAPAARARYGARRTE